MLPAEGLLPGLRPPLEAPAPGLRLPVVQGLDAAVLGLRVPVEVPPPENAAIGMDRSPSASAGTGAAPGGLQPCARLGLRRSDGPSLPSHAAMGAPPGGAGDSDLPGDSGLRSGVLMHSQALGVPLSALELTTRTGPGDMGRTSTTMSRPEPLGMSIKDGERLEWAPVWDVAGRDGLLVALVCRALASWTVALGLRCVICGEVPRFCGSSTRRLRLVCSFGTGRRPKPSGRELGERGVVSWEKERGLETSWREAGDVGSPSCPTAQTSRSRSSSAAESRVTALTNGRGCPTSMSWAGWASASVLGRREGWLLLVPREDGDPTVDHELQMG